MRPVHRAQVRILLLAIGGWATVAFVVCLGILGAWVMIG